MDAELRDLFNSTVSVRRATSIARSGQGADTLGAAVTLACYLETKSEYFVAEQSQRKTRHEVTIDPADVAASTLVVLRDTDLFWIEGTDPSKPAFGLKPKRLWSAKDPDTGVVDHYEVTL